MSFGTSPFGTTSFGADSTELMSTAIVEAIENSSDKLREALSIQAIIQDACQSGDLNKASKLQKYEKLSAWIPDTPEKLAAYIGIITIIIHMLTTEPEKKIEVNTVFITNVYTYINETNSNR
ncbi:MULTISPECIES: hypothetical protein [Methylobacter]